MREVHLIQNKIRGDGWNVTSVHRVWAVMVRVNLRVALGALCVAALLLMMYWGHCADFAHRPVGSAVSERSGALDDIECEINGEYSVGCRREPERDEVFVPFSLIHKYFEIYGKVTSADGVDKFEWSHSYGKIYRPKKRYDPRGTFVTFENYNVEVRERVKCISGVEGVPVSTQWEPRGFFYPTQIAQYGLAHYSKHIAEPEPTVKVIDDGEKHTDNWVASEDATVARQYDATLKTNIIRFTTSNDPSSQVVVNLNITQDFVLSVDLALQPNATLTVVLQNKDRRRESVHLHYVMNNQLIYTAESHVYHGIGESASWRTLTRDLVVDMQKGWALQDRPRRRAPRNKYMITSIILTGSGAFDNVTISSSAHMAMFYAAARWLTRAQRGARGGWPVPARRRLAAGRPDLMPGWHSAMSQGHAISVLSRAYYRSGDDTYLAAAKRALYLLDVPSDAGGVKAVFMDKYVWYEEYPTKPPLFVLNGFIYTLLGLYDLHVIEGENSISLAKKMFDDGMTSLKTLLPLFDTGSGSFYDLRHFTSGVSPNIARWDYHATHVNQLYLLATLDEDPILMNTAKRWEGYMRGKRAAHN